MNSHTHNDLFVPVYVDDTNTLVFGNTDVGVDAELNDIRCFLAHFATCFANMNIHRIVG